MKKILLSTLVAILAFSGYAATTAQLKSLDGYICALVFKGSRSQYGLADCVMTGRLYYATDVNRLRIRGFFGGLGSNSGDGFDVALFQNGNNTYLPNYNAGQNDAMVAGKFNGIDQYICIYGATYKNAPRFYDRYGNTIYSHNYTTHSSNITTTFGASPYGTGYLIKVSTPFEIQMCDTGYTTINWDEVFDGLEIWAFPANATQTDDDDEPYNIRVESTNRIPDTNGYYNFNLLNFANQGCGLTSTINGSTLVGSYTPKPFIGKYNYDTNSFIINAQPAYTETDHEYIGYYNDYYPMVDLDADYITYYNLCSNYAGNDEYEAITSTNVIPTLAHKFGGWSKMCNGNLETVISHLNVTLGKYQFCSGNDVSGSSNRSTLDFDCELDITHEASFNISHYGYDNARHGVYVKGVVRAEKNLTHVNDYQLFIMPGEFHSVNDAGFDAAFEKAVDITYTYNTQYNPVAQMQVKRKVGSLLDGGNPGGGLGGGSLSGDDDQYVTEFDIQKQIPASALQRLGIGDADTYTFFIKANYTDESGLESTYHALTTSAITTGVEDILTSIEPEETVEYFNLNGVQVDGNNLTPGIYVKRQGKTSTKVWIR